MISESQKKKKITTLCFDPCRCRLAYSALRPKLKFGKFQYHIIIWTSLTDQLPMGINGKTSWYNTMMYLTLTLTQGQMSNFKVKVQIGWTRICNLGISCGGVCALWMLMLSCYDIYFLFPICLFIHYTSTKSWRGYIFTAVCLSVCVCVCVYVCVRLISCEQNSTRTDSPISTRLSLNGCLLQWLEPYWNWWPGPGSNVKVTVNKNVCKNDEKNSPKFKSRHLLNQISSFDRKFYHRHFDTKHYHIAK